MLLSRTGYTGEDGFELYFPNAFAEELWDAFLDHGEKHGVKPIGLGARDTLRLEARMPPSTATTSTRKPLRKRVWDVLSSCIKISSAAMPCSSRKKRGSSANW